MYWTEKPNKTFPKWPYQMLVTESGGPIKPALVEYWKRILTDGFSLPPASRVALSMQILSDSIAAGNTGSVQASFQKSTKSQSEGIGIFIVTSDHFNFAQGENEDRAAFDRRELEWWLEQYKLVKEAIRDPQTWPLFEKMHASRAITVQAATANGWFELRPGQEGFGPLPANDQRLLAGKARTPDDPLKDLTSGVLDVERMRLVQAVNAALIQYTPPHFKNIQCKITEGMEQGQLALFYDIQCPEYPEEGTDRADARLHSAATRLVQHLTAEMGSFPGVSIKLNMQPDGNWLHSLELLKKQ